jgi:uncharacterized protein (TIGR03790 family)
VQRTTKLVRLHIIASLAVLLCHGQSGTPAPPDPATVLIIVNDATPAEQGTGTLGASEYVGWYYAGARHIPLSNVFHISTAGGPSSDPHDPLGWHISWEEFNARIRVPLKDFLESRQLERKIKYIVPTYGVPTHISSYKGYENLSVDSFLASIYSPASDDIGSSNAVFSADSKSMPAHWSSEELTWPVYAVARLDGSTPALAVSLVERALQAERGITRSSGIGYFNQAGLTGTTPRAIADQSILSAARLCTEAGLSCQLNDQSVSGRTISAAPNTLWALGWSDASSSDAYTFAPGAVGAQVTSGAAGTLRSVEPGTPAPLWIAEGITATWGTTSEPSGLYTAGDSLLNHLWNGYSFGEAAYIATPSLNWMMIFLGDPLYTPVFLDGTRPAVASRTGSQGTKAASLGALASAPRVISAVAAGTVTLTLGSATGTKGGSVPLNLTLASSGGALPAAVQWTFSYSSSDITGVTVAPGLSATTAGKFVTCPTNTCVAYGLLNGVLNSNTITNGTVAVATFQIASNTSSTTIPIQVTTTVASSGAGDSIQASASGGTITIITLPAQKIGTYNAGQWQLDVTGDGILGSGDKNFFLGFSGATPVLGDWNGDGRTKAGVYSNGYWYLDYDGNGVWDGGINDKLVPLGWPGATPVVGDWNGNGKTKIGVYSNGFWFLDYNGDFIWDGGVVDKQIGWGWAGVTPVVGDWNGNGKTKIGVYSNGFWFLDYNGDFIWDGGVADKQYGFGWAGVTPIVGDWNGDGRTKVGVYSAGNWYVDYTGSYNPASYTIWTLGWSGTTPVIGDWNGDGRSKAGAFINGYWYLDYNGNGVFDGASTDRLFAFGAAGDTPVAGRW